MYKKLIGRGALKMLLALALVNCGTETEPVVDGGGDGAGHQPNQCGLRFPDVPDLFTAWDGPRLPLMTVDTYGNPILDPHKIRSLITIEEFDNKGEPIQNSSHEAGIEIRGSFSSGFPKKSYSLELRKYHFGEGSDDNDNEADPHGYHSKDVKASLLGMPEESDWVLYGPHVDKSLMRNMLMYDLSNDIGRYAPRGRFIDLKINGELQGTYSLFEKIKRDKQRVDIAKLKSNDNNGKALTGGYIIKIDKIKPEAGQSVDDLSFPSKHPSGSSQVHRFSYDYPKAEDITDQQKNYIQNYIHNFESALNSDDYKDDDIGYKAFIDVDSFVDYFLLTELSHNVDGYRISTFLVKDKNKRLSMGPIWDYNFALGNVRNEFCNGSDWSEWAYKFNSFCPQDFYQVPFWWDRLLSDSHFTEKLDKRWRELRANVLSDESILNKIDSYATTLNNTGSAMQNFAAWDTLGCFIWPNFFVGDTFQKEVDHLKDWTLKRANWMDENINDTNTFL